MIERVATGHFITRTEECPNAHRGASFMIGIGISTPNSSVSWDRGFAVESSRVWGPEDGGYVFRRLAD